MPQLDTDRFHKKAKRLVANDFNDKIVGGRRYLNGPDISEDDFYVTWFAKTLGIWKALVSTDIVDGQYWEVTYNGAKNETYVDHYSKVSNACYPDTGYDRRFPDESISQERAERAEFREDVHHAAQWAAKALKEGGHDNASIAGELGISESAVRVLLVP